MNSSYEVNKMQNNLDFVHQKTMELFYIKRLLRKKKRKINSLIIGREFTRKKFYYVIARKRENTEPKKKNLSETDILLIDLQEDNLTITQWIHKMSQSRYIELNCDCFLSLKKAIPISAISFSNLIIQLSANGEI